MAILDHILLAITHAANTTRVYLSMYQFGRNPVSHLHTVNTAYAAVGVGHPNETQCTPLGLARVVHHSRDIS
jgi:hypothetical protein